MGLIVAHDVGGALTAPNGSEKLCRAMLETVHLNRQIFSFLTRFCSSHQLLLLFASHHKIESKLSWHFLLIIW